MFSCAGNDSDVKTTLEIAREGGLEVKAVSEDFYKVFDGKVLVYAALKKEPNIWLCRCNENYFQR